MEKEIIKTVEPMIKKLVSQYQFIGIPEDHLRGKMDKKIK